jgi:ADP-ribose pyrophosphatase YjhB (NUDIX family)
MQPESPFYRVSLKAIVFDDQQRLLVVKNTKGEWKLPGGGWEHDESMQHCLRRELMEELSAHIKHIDFKAMYPYTGVRPQGGMSLKLAIPVILTDHTFEIGDDMVEYAFVTSEELAKLYMDTSEVGIKNQIDRLWRDRS